ncbi:hypothetical protein [Achromobacter aegrifaciens]
MELWPLICITPEQFDALSDAYKQLLEAITMAFLAKVERLSAVVLRLDQVSCDLKRPGGLMGGIYDDCWQAWPRNPMCWRKTR